MPLDEKSHFCPSFGPVFHGKWSPGYVESNRRIYDFELVYFAAGTTRVITPGAAFSCRAGSAILIPPDLVHCSVAVDEVERWCIHFDWFSDCRGPRGLSDVFVYTDSQTPFRPELCASAPEGLSFPMTAGADPSLLPLIRGYFQHTQTHAHPLTRQGQLLLILGAILEQTESIPAPRPINQLALVAKNRIDEKCRDFSLTVSQIAREMHVTGNHLSRLFKLQFGCSITDYIAQKRMGRIREILSDPTLSIGEVASRCGFADANYFCRFFRRQTGISPGAYRKQSSEVFSPPCPGLWAKNPDGLSGDGKGYARPSWEDDTP